VNNGDIGTWAAVIVALVFSAIASVLSWKSLRWERVGAQAAVRSAEEAGRANRLAERALQRENLVIKPTAEKPDVSWVIEHPGGTRFVLRNRGTETADEVTIDPDNTSVIARDLPDDAVVRPGEGVDILLLATWLNPLPNQLYVTWRGQTEPVAVPLPA